MKIIQTSQITQVVRQLCMKACCILPQDVQECIAQFCQKETWPTARDTLHKITQNYQLAIEHNVPICQDTGMACVFVELGQEVHIDGNLYAAINEGVRQGYQDGYLRKSVVSDPLERINTKDNTPAMIYLDFVPGDTVAITVAPKGFGSENMSQIKMLAPSDGIEGVIDFVVDVVEAAGPNPCPPIIVGVGIGGTFDKAALIAKKALLRPLNVHNPLPYYAQLEETLLTKINALGIGPQGFGGLTTALGVAVEVLPTHIAGLPCAVNINCHAARHETEVIG